MYGKSNMFRTFQEYKQAISEISTDVSNDDKLIEFDKHVEALLGILKTVITRRIKYFTYNKCQW